MSIERSQSAAGTDSSSRTEAARDTRDSQRTPPLRENVDRFRTLMQDKAQAGGTPDAPPGKAALLGEDVAHDTAARHGVTADASAAVDADVLRRSRDEKGVSSSALQAADASAVFQAQMAVRDGIPQVHTPVNPNAFADMVERHVRQLAIGRHGEARGDGQMLLRMSDATLPGTDLLLSRTSDGCWLLRADIRSRNSFDAITDAAPELTKRFAERNLGTLSIDPHFHR
ncbi:MAG: hypothetical protein ACREO8_09560 [Luteimonas sp.]